MDPQGFTGSGLAEPFPLSGIPFGQDQGGPQQGMPVSGIQAPGGPAQAQGGDQSADSGIDPLLLQAIMAQLEAGGGPGLGNTPLLDPFAGTVGQGGGVLGQFGPQFGPQFLQAGQMQSQGPPGTAPGTAPGGDNTQKTLAAISQLVKLASPFIGSDQQPDQGTRGPSDTLADTLRSAQGGVSGTGPGGDTPIGGTGATLGQGNAASGGGGTLGQFQNQILDPRAPADASLGTLTIQSPSAGLPGIPGQFSPITDPLVADLLNRGMPLRDIQELLSQSQLPPGSGTALEQVSGGELGIGAPGTTPTGQPESLSGAPGGSQGGLSFSGAIQGAGGALGGATGLLGLLNAIRGGDTGAEAQASLKLLSSLASLPGNQGVQQVAGQGASDLSGTLNSASVSGSLGGDLGALAGVAGLARDLAAKNYPGVTSDALGLLKTLYSLYSAAQSAGSGAVGTAGASSASAADAALGGTTDAAGAATGSALGSALGTYGGVTAVYDLAKLGFELGLGSEGPSSNNQYLDAVMGLLGPVGDIIGLSARGAFTPSESWITYPQRLRQTLGLENRELNSLLTELGNAQNRGDITQDAQLFANAIGSQVGGYGITTGDQGQPVLGALPGATGKRHEGNVTADFSPEVDALNQLMAAMYASAPAGQATPLSQNAFNWGATEGQYGQVNDFTQQMIAGGAPDISGLPPALQRLIADNVWGYRNQLQQQALADSLMGGMTPTGSGGGTGL